MAGLILSGALLCLAPVVGVLGVAGLLAVHEYRLRKGREDGLASGRRASTELFDEFWTEAEVPALLAAHGRTKSRAAMRVVRRASPHLLYEHLDERAPKMAAPRRRVYTPAPVRAARPTRLVPLTA